jgi:hypothetical protein
MTRGGGTATRLVEVFNSTTGAGTDFETGRSVAGALTSGGTG